MHAMGVAKNENKKKQTKKVNKTEVAFFFWPASSTWSSLARDQIQGSDATYATAAAMPNP